MNTYVYLLFIWFFLQYQLAIFLISAIRPKSSTTTKKCPICSIHFPRRFHHCFLVNRCISICNVHCFLSFTFYATLATLMCFLIFFHEFFRTSVIHTSCLFPLGEFACRNLTWTQRVLVMLTRSTLIAAGCASAMGIHVAKDFYSELSTHSRSVYREIMKILLPTLSVIRYE
jgi:hypothetical protein